MAVIAFRRKGHPTPPPHRALISFTTEDAEDREDREDREKSPAGGEAAS